MDYPPTLVIWVQDELRHRASDYATMLSAGSRFADAVGDGHAHTQQIRYAANTRRTIRVIVAGVLQQVVLHQAIASNSVRKLNASSPPRATARPHRVV
ncbi:MAG: hypothetical protein ACRDTA_25360 [Pseudonocardiaceae bacterium]